MKNIIIASSIALFLSSCMVIHTGQMGGITPVTENNFSYINNAYGSSKVTYVLGIGGFNKVGLVREAKNDLIRNYPVKNGEALVNFTVDFDTSYYFGLVVTQKVIVSADIIKFD